MRTTRWFIERGEDLVGWIDSAHNPPEGWESEKAATSWYRNTFPTYRLGNVRVVSREVEVDAKDIVKTKFQSLIESMMEIEENIGNTKRELRLSSIYFNE
ncbi:hypothetical protein [Pseudanabaena phage PA-SR01]|nr:hypothetical protein [Pseudanabaena phage PA-SR01]